MRRATSDGTNSDEMFNARRWHLRLERINGVPSGHRSFGNLAAAVRFILSGTLSLNSGPAFGNIIAQWNGLTDGSQGACCFGNFGGALFRRRTSRTRNWTSGRQNLQDALGSRSHDRFRSIQRLQLAESHLFDVGRGGWQSPAAYREWAGCQRPASVPGGAKVQILVSACRNREGDGNVPLLSF